jgi:hypothetical protein
VVVVVGAIQKHEKLKFSMENSNFGSNDQELSTQFTCCGRAWCCRCSCRGLNENLNILRYWYQI